MRPPENFYHANIAEDHSRSSCSLNRCNLSPWIIGSDEFQANPQPIEIDGTRTTDSRLFRRLSEIPDQEERSRLFHDYVCIKFGLTEAVSVDPDGKPHPMHGYAYFLRSWGADSNGPAGAVLKSWVESRFGLLATYHQGRLADNASARAAFQTDRMRGTAKSIGVLMQLDLLYTFCQEELRRRFPDDRWLTLYRGTHDPEEYAIHSMNPSGKSTIKRQALVQLNNLSSFSSDPEVAWEFGSNVWEVKVPIPKIIFFSGLLPKSLLTGESEYLVLGGYYNVRSLIC